MRRYAIMAIAIASLAAFGCTRQQPSAPPAAVGDASRQESTIAAWDDYLDATRAKVPPLGTLAWEPLKEGSDVPQGALVLTGDGASVQFAVKAVIFPATVLTAIRNGAMLGHVIDGDQVILTVDSNVLFPMRPPQLPRQAAAVRAVRVAGPVLFSRDMAGIKDGFGELAALRLTTNSPGPSSASSRIQVKKGLGIRAKDLSGLPAAERSAIPVKHGVLIAEVLPQSPAHRAGLLFGDIIVGVGAKAIRGPEDLQKALAVAAADKVLKLRVFRPMPLLGEELTIEIQPGAFEGDPTYASPKVIDETGVDQ